jgi:hypothetical protein
MMDMTAVIQPKSDQINADDLIPGPMTVTIEGVQIEAKTEQPVSIRIVGNPKVFRPCKSMARVMVQAWGADAAKYAGRSLTLYRDPKVKWGGMEVGGIRISHMSHIDGPMQMMLTQTRSQRAPFKVLPLAAAPESPAAPDNAEELARAAASKGKAGFTAWWNSDEGKACRNAVKPIMAELQEAVAKADAAMPGEEECPI